MGNKIRKYISGIAGIIYVALFFMNAQIPRSIFLTLMGIIVVNAIIDEWYLYKKTKKKMHLIVPVLSFLGAGYLLIDSML